MLEIRRIRKGEWEILRAVRLQALLESPEAFKITYATAFSRRPESWIQQCDDSATGSDRCTCLAFDGNRPLGIAALYRLPDDQTACCELIQVWVAPEYRGGGIAAKLQKALFSWARENAYSEIIATVHVENSDVIGFYEKLGFRVDPVATAKTPPRDIVLRLKLS